MATRASLGRTLPAQLVGLGVLLSTSACSWSRFDDVSDNPPVVQLKKPDTMKTGFGVSLATATVPGDSTRVLVAGTPGENPAAAFDLGLATNPQVDAKDTGFCNSDEPCWVGGQVAGLAKADVGGTEFGQYCFVVGAGKAEGFTEYGLYGRCSGGTEYTLDVPASVLKRVIKDELIDQEEAAQATIRLAADKDEAAALIAGAKEQGLGWYYRPLSSEPVELRSPGKADVSFGASEAVLRFESGNEKGERLAIIGAPDAGHVWIFSGDGEGRPLGCLGGISGFGRALATGHVDKDDIDDLVIADDTSVTVISGAALRGLTPNDDITCSMAVLPEGAIIASFGCGSGGAVTGCPGRFGESLDVGDIDGDGDGEVLVGASGVTVRGTKNAGAVLVYDAEGDSPEELSDILYVGSREDGDRLGSTVVAAPIEGRDVVVAGIPGSGRTAVFYCSKLVEDGGGRCE
jgi:hypothetical protein